HGQPGYAEVEPHEGVKFFGRSSDHFLQRSEPVTVTTAVRPLGSNLGFGNGSDQNGSRKLDEWSQFGLRSTSSPRLINHDGRAALEEGASSRVGRHKRMLAVFATH